MTAGACALRRRHCVARTAFGQCLTTTKKLNGLPAPLARHQRATLATPTITANMVIRPKACRRRRSRRHNEAKRSAVVGPKDRRLHLTLFSCSAVQPLSCSALYAPQSFFSSFMCWMRRSLNSRAESWPIPRRAWTMAATSARRAISRPGRTGKVMCGTLRPRIS